MHIKLKRTRWILVFVGLSLFTLLTSCGEDNPFAPVDQRGENEIWIFADRYEPSSLTISAGETVTFTNKDEQRRGVNSGTPPNNVGSAFTINNLATEGSQSIRLNTVGVYPFYDPVEFFTGQIIVQ